MPSMAWEARNGGSLSLEGVTGPTVSTRSRCVALRWASWSTFTSTRVELWSAVCCRSRRSTGMPADWERIENAIPSASNTSASQWSRRWPRPRSACFAAGGPLEVVRDGSDGYHWTTLDQLVELTRQLIDDEDLRQRLSRSAQQRAAEFSASRFELAIGELST